MGSFPSALATGDFNGDGKPDLAVINQNSKTVSVLQNLGNGTFAPAVDYPTHPAPSSIAVADFNGDGKPDLTIVDQSSNAGVSVLLNLGDGTFGPEVTYPVTVNDFPASVAAADFNGDGRPDLAVMVYAPINGGHVNVLLNQGNGAFAAPASYNVTNMHSGTITAADLDGDGKPDLAVTSYELFAKGTLSVLLNQGNGTFGAPVAYKAGDAPYSIAAADLDGDGKLDLAVVSRGSASIINANVSVLRNQGNGTFAPPANYVAGAIPRRSRRWTSTATASSTSPSSGSTTRCTRCATWATAPF